MSWLLNQDTAREIAAMRRGMPAPTVEQRSAFRVQCLQDKHTDVDAARSRRMNTAGSVAEIPVSGVLVKQPSFLLFLLGFEQTAYSDIVDALGAASLDATIKSVVLKVDSPGGSVDGLFDTLAAIQAFDKPLSVLATQACSAAYAIAAVAGKITATSVAASFGSIGVVASVEVDEDVVEITSTEAPEKRPDVTTPEGRAVVVRHLDAIHGLFADAIASGRGTTVTDVNANFGRGSVLLAADAKSRGMVDAVAKPQAKKEGIGASAADSKTEDRNMDLRTFKAQHGELYETVHDTAFAAGAAAEQDRVSAFLTLGKSGGDQGMEKAFADIKSGKPMTMGAMAEYQALALNAQARSLRGGDEAAVATAANGATPPAATTTTQPGATTAEGDSVQDIVVARMMARRGKKVA